MLTIQDALKAINAYPVPMYKLDEVCICRGLLLEDDAVGKVLHSDAYMLATADILLWLSKAPNISQGGQSYSFSEDQRKDMANRAYALYKVYGTESDPQPIRTQYGYKGEML